MRNAENHFSSEQLPAHPDHRAHCSQWLDICRGKARRQRSIAAATARPVEGI
jgi:hypothetical protein